jgi:uncharacterized membrane protein YeaQ/YmgE (transglycosylase-associated protein family)
MALDSQSILVWLVVGLIAGWLAGLVMKGGGFGIVGDIVIGIIGAFIGGLLLPRLGLGIPAGFLGSIVVAFVGAVILLLILRLVAGGSSRRRA